MPLFIDVASDGGVYGMWLYWVLTGLLIIVVFVAWWVYIRRRFKKMKAMNSEFAI